MNIESLKYFYLIARAGNISSVARDEHISQSALSQQINKLESELAKTLMERSNKGVKLTTTGEIVYRYAENVLKNYDNMLNDISEYEKQNMVIKIIAPQSIADYGLPCTMILANKKYPLHKYELYSGSSEQIITDVANNLYDIGFSYCEGKNKDKYTDLICLSSGLNRVILIGKNNKDLPAEMDIDQILNSSIITFTGEGEINRRLETNFNKTDSLHKKTDSSVEVCTIESTKKLISRGYGLAFLPYMSVKEELYKKEFKEIAVPSFDLDLEINMLFKKNHSDYVEEFIKWFKNEGKKSFC